LEFQQKGGNEMKTLSFSSICRSLICLFVLVLFSGSANAQRFLDSTALFVVADRANPNTAEISIVTRLEGIGFLMTTLGQNEVNDAAAEGMSLVLISATVSSGTIVTNMPGLKDLPMPVINWEPFLYDDQGFQAANGGEFNTSLVEIINANHPLAAGLPEGPIQITSSERGVSYGTPEGDAIIIAVNPNDYTQAVLFGYEKGAAMAVGNAPARRVGTFLLNDAADSLTADGWALFDSSVVWAMGTKSSTSVEELSLGLPSDFVLYDNYPNPFNPETHIAFSIPTQNRVRLSVWNALGEKVTTLVDEVRAAGKYTALFNASEFSSGVFFYKLEAGSYTLTKKMLFLK
jgi:hypothetical protein